MKIRLNNIGIVNDSTISLDGLTVVTGANNSGKTTVGKAVYSLLDAVSNISLKARNDRSQYIMSKLDSIEEVLDLFRFFRALDFDENTEEIAELTTLKYPVLFSVLSNDYRHEVSPDDVEDYAHKLQKELVAIDVDELSKIELLKGFVRYVSHDKSDEIDIKKMLTEQIDAAKEILTEMFFSLEKDPQLIEYARESINQTLNVEFFGQIQPVRVTVAESKIEVYDEGACCFSVKLINNKVVNDGKPVFTTSPYKRTFFIDNPFIFDDSSLVRRFHRNPLDASASSLLNPHNIISHNIKLRSVLRQANQMSVLEQTIVNDALEKIKQKINAIIPGSFDFSPKGDYYLQNGVKLKFSNLATGSKLFSIIKILLESGRLDKSTVLILDEPEAHLHPSWENRFAEMIVLIVKELGVNVLLTTHSSNFLLALDAYMRKYKIENTTNFYRTEFNENNMVDYVCANDDIGVIYQEFLQYLSEMKMLRDDCIRSAGEDS